MQRPIQDVIAPQAGIQACPAWIPAYAGTTSQGFPRSARDGIRPGAGIARKAPRSPGSLVRIRRRSGTRSPRSIRPPRRQVLRHGGTLPPHEPPGPHEAGCSTKEKDQRGRPPYLQVAHRSFTGEQQSCLQHAQERIGGHEQAHHAQDEQREELEGRPHELAPATARATSRAESTADRGLTPPRCQCSPPRVWDTSSSAPPAPRPESSSRSSRA
jgi:hypothetical protein